MNIGISCEAGDAGDMIFRIAARRIPVISRSSVEEFQSGNYVVGLYALHEREEVCGRFDQEDNVRTPTSAGILPHHHCDDLVEPPANCEA